MRQARRTWPAACEFLSERPASGIDGFSHKIWAGFLIGGGAEAMN
jgi:hypothetical protein